MNNRVSLLTIPCSLTVNRLFSFQATNVIMVQLISDPLLFLNDINPTQNPVIFFILFMDKIISL